MIPVYDRTRYLHECISSVLNQTFDSYEVIIVMEGTPFETREIVRHFSNLSKVRVFRYEQATGTACRCRNKGILEARGKYISLLDSDDLSDPLRLERTKNIIDSTDADVVYGSIKFFCDEGRSIDGIKFGDTALPNPNGFDLDELIKQNQIYTLSTSIKRSTLIELGGFRPEMRYREDYELWLRLCYKKSKFSFTNDVLSIYRIHGKNNELTFKSSDEEWYQKSLHWYNKPFDNWGEI